MRRRRGVASPGAMALAAVGEVTELALAARYVLCMVGPLWCGRRPRDEATQGGAEPGVEPAGVSRPPQGSAVR